MGKRIILKLVLSLCCIFLINCKPDKKDTNNKFLVNEVDNVLVVFYEQHTGNDFNPNDNYIVSIKKGDPCIKYTNFLDENLLSNPMKDIILINKAENYNISNFFRSENAELKEVYSDSNNKDFTRRIYFLNKDKSIVKYIEIIGEPHNIDYLKNSCDFLLKKINDDKKGIRK
jgi:hypothetical protein